MQVLVDRSFRRVFQNMPYIDQSELKRNVLLYDPNGYNLDCGLYERPRPACQRWVDHAHQFEMMHGTRPQYMVKADGTTVYPASRFNKNYPPYLPSPYRQ